MFYSMCLADSVDAGNVNVHQVVHKADDLSVDHPLYNNYNRIFGRAPYINSLKN
jgi:hypothetical protein